MSFYLTHHSNWLIIKLLHINVFILFRYIFFIIIIIIILFYYFGFFFFHKQTLHRILTICLIVILESDFLIIQKSKIYFQKLFLKTISTRNLLYLILFIQIFFPFIFPPLPNFRGNFLIKSHFHQNFLSIYFFPLTKFSRQFPY